MTRLAVIGDVHANFKLLGRVLSRVEAVGVDGVLMVGDLACAGLGERNAKKLGLYRRRVREVLAAVEALDVPICYVPGNHDLRSLRYPGNVDGEQAEIDGLTITGIGGTNPPRRGFPYEWTDDEIRARSVPPSDIIISHCPPADTPLDFAKGAGRHVGSAAIRERAEAHHGVLVCGHIHESFGVAQLSGCLMMNAGGLGRPFGCAQVGFVEGIDEIRHENLQTGRFVSLRRDGEIERGRITGRV
ncbi:MAG: metallophosphoesterase family protein [Myxococcota bacterium]|nr:metallophosphoesterase family protein [Myxococcota bacterium]